jgi:hypothetical protein
VGGIFAGTTPADIQAQNVKLQAQIAALTQKFDDAAKAAGKTNNIDNSGLKVKS